MPDLSVAIVAGLHADARRATVAQLLHDVPGSVVLHHDLATAAAGVVVRTTRDATGILSLVETPLVNDCACCALREDLVPELRRLASSGQVPLAIVELWDSVEPKAMAEVIASGGLTLTGVITAVDAALLLPYLGNGDDLSTAGLAAAATDQRTIADTFARQLEYAPVLAVLDSDQADDEDRELLGQLHPTARQIPLGQGDLRWDAIERDDLTGSTQPPQGDLEDSAPPPHGDLADSAPPTRGDLEGSAQPAPGNSAGTAPPLHGDPADSASLPRDGLTGTQPPHGDLADSVWPAHGGSACSASLPPGDLADAAPPAHGDSASSASPPRQDLAGSAQPARGDLVGPAQSPHGDLAGPDQPPHGDSGDSTPPPHRNSPSSPQPPRSPLASAALAGFDVEAAAAAQHPACALLPVEADNHGVSTFVWHRCRPFHPERLYDALEDLTCAAARSRGRFWLADKPDSLLHWDAAGGALCVESAGPWLASLPDAAWELVPPVRRAAAALDWHPEHGDCCQHLVFTSPGLDRDGLEQLLESCLLTDTEYAAGRAAWKRLPPAFDTLLEI
ncbi:CobW family GTP-binding protein [Streptomyces xylophagus]|uniref:GTP-binding protein n=1 Tax=Streptomyces xylophagus TaxID=285514 RepID=UPI0005B99129|nr:GTP-binding protein [Streptomyces xylophagus]